ncbi:MAG TPA: PTS sugar transporter subunit IIC [Lachnospiraceae bacterium]|nr:PTS sugar transporter subunit IIC [Lachnospiraceae bacterium]
MSSTGITLLVAFILACYYGFYSTYPFMILMGPAGMGSIIGLIIGLIMGDPVKGIEVGALIQTMYMGVVGYGGVLPVDQFFACIIAIPLAISSGMSNESALALAAGFGALGVMIDTLWKTINTSVWTPYIDRACEKNQYRKIAKGAGLYPILTRMAISVPIITVLLFLGSTAVNWLMDNLPEWLQVGFNNMGTILPAMGFAMFVSYIGKKELIPFFIIGFYVMKFASLPIIGMAIFGAFIAWLVAKTDKSSDTEGGLA